MMKKGVTHVSDLGPTQGPKPEEKKYKEADPPKSPRSKHPLGILKQAHDTTRQETRGGGRDKKARKKENI